MQTRKYRKKLLKLMGSLVGLRQMLIVTHLWRSISPCMVGTSFCMHDLPSFHVQKMEPQCFAVYTLNISICSIQDVNQTPQSHPCCFTCQLCSHVCIKYSHNVKVPATFSHLPVVCFLDHTFPERLQVQQWRHFPILQIQSKP